MKILRLELFGFKSFKDKTIVTFDQPITAVVGSNGCGKSNIVDALYWVMGDMSPKHLRGAHMSDVIFSGSRDAAALDMAEVTLVLERDPTKDPELPPQFQGSNEIQITRRYYRSGDSECFINKVGCRLRDIQEFFMDTGLGAKAYSIIEQGAIMRMVTQKPEERRVVIEEVAGVMKFKARKAETERKLEHSNTNLLRIDDIVKDLQKQLGSLKRQAEKAEKYKVLSDELRNLEIRIASREWVNRNENKSQSQIAINELSVRYTSTETDLERERAQVEEDRAKLSELENELNSRRENSRQLELTLKDIESRLSALQARREAISRRLGQDRLSLEELERREESLREELGNLETDIAGVKEESINLHSKADEVSADVQSIRDATDGLRLEVENARKQHHNEEIEETRLTQQIQEHQRFLSQLSSRQESLEFQLSNIGTEHDLRNSERQSTLDFLEVAFSTRSDLESEKNTVNADLERLENQRTELNTERDEIKRELTVVQIKKDQFEALEKDLEGVNATSRSLAFHLREEGHSQTLLADTVKVPAVLEKAVEAVLGRHLQRVLATSFDKAEKLQEFLARSTDGEAKKGRSSMWIADLSERHAQIYPGTDLGSIYLSQSEMRSAEMGSVEMRMASEVPGPDGIIAYADTEVIKTPMTAKEFLLDHPQVVGPLSDLVRNESADAPWVHLVRDFWVVRSKDTFHELFDELGGLPVNFVSLDGDLLAQDGFLDLAPLDLTASEQGVGLVQRKREIAELAGRQSDLETKLHLAQSRCDECLASLVRAKEKFQELTARLSALNPDVEKHSLLLRQVEAQVARLLEKRSILGEDLEKSIADHAETSLKLEEITERLAQTAERKALIETTLAQVQERLAASKQHQIARESELQVLQRSARDVDSRLSDLKSRMAAAEQEQSLSETRKGQVNEEITRLSGEISEIETTRDEDSQVRAQQQIAFESAAEETETFSRSFESKKRASLEQQRHLEKLSADMQNLAVAIKDVEQTLAVNDVELKNISQSLQSKYQITLDSLGDDKLRELLSPGDFEEMADPESGKIRANSLRNRIDNLGKINMVAIEEFGELSKRHDYLFIQRQDLADAISQLRDAIDKIDRESRHRFAEAFAAVNQAFQTTFPILFGGGNAELRLTNPDNLLETGVEIVAQPPGKKLQSVTLLSGGEKALTAVSLIFGIFSIKPSPFCVLDEVDAPLDDSNVNRFNNQVRRMAETSQMILITHHKKTMESCDALFGVTMERPGISKVASAKLAEYKPSA